MPISVPVTTATIGGVSYTADQLAAAGIEVNSWGWDLDTGDLSAEITESGPNLPDPQRPTFLLGLAVTLACDGTPVFRGEIASYYPARGQGGEWRFGYRCRGPRYQLDRVRITAADGTGRMSFNLDPRDEDYALDLAGLEVGEILTEILDEHTAELSALGISTDATTTAQLAALTLVPLDPVTVSGRLGQGIDSVLRQWARNVCFFVTAAGKVRFLDTTAGTARTLAEGSDYLEPIRLAGSIEETATRVVVRGSARVYPFNASILTNTLVPAWTGPQQAAWSLSDYEQPGDAYSEGSVVSMGSNTVTIHATDAVRTWGVNFWSDRKAWIYLRKSAGTGLTFSESRPVIACDAMTAGGNCTLTVAFPWENAGSGAYDSYELIGNSGALSGTYSSRSDVYRLFDIDTPGDLVESALKTRFPADVGFFGYYGDTVVNTRYPTAVLVKDGVTIPASFKVLPTTGQIRFDEPVVKLYNTPSQLAAGGSAVNLPDDVYALLAYSRGALEAAYPPDVSGSPVYSGDAFDLWGLERTHPVEIEAWTYEGDKSRYQAYAEMLHKALSAVAWTGSARILGAYANAFEPTLRVNITGGGCGTWSTGHESVSAPVRSFTLRYHHDASGGVLHSSELRVDSRRNPAVGDRYYDHPTQLGQLGFKLPLGSLDFSRAMPSVNTVGPAGAFVGLANGLAAGGLAGVGASVAGTMGDASGLVGGGAGAASSASSDAVTQALAAVFDSMRRAGGAINGQ